MSVEVTLVGGPVPGVVTVTGPWPRTFIVRESGGSFATYTVDNPEGPAPYTATYFDETLIEGGDEFYDPVPVGPAGPTGPSGPQGADGAVGPPGPTFNPMGLWDYVPIYDFLDLVHDADGNSFVSLQGPNVNKPLPTAPDFTATDYWQLIAERGPQGLQGLQGVQGEPGQDGEQGPPGSPLPPREQITVTHTGLAANTGASKTIPMSPGYRVLKVESTGPFRLRLYTTAAKRDADVGRLITEDPTGDHGCVLEVVGLTTFSWDLTWATNGYSLEASPSAWIPGRLENLDTVSQNMSVTLTWQPQES